jgi:murein DD-endopeptidase MepM/ murein hydrolase activator NlpD
MTDRPDEPVAERRFTVMFVPEGASGSVRQWSFTLADARRVVILLSMLVLVVLFGLWDGAGLLSPGPSRGEILDENLALKARLRAVEGRMDEVDRELRRLRQYGAQMESSGLGPLESDELSPAAEAGLLGASMPAPDRLVGQAQTEMMDEPAGGVEAELDRHDAGRWMERLGERAERLLRSVRFAESRLGPVAEAAEGARSRTAAIPTDWPVDALLTSGFGWRRSPFNRRWKFHSGLDLACDRGTAVKAPAAGVVIYADWDQGYGKLLEVDHGYGVVTRYAHNSQLLVATGDHVRRGQVISTVGMTGQTTGPHLHYEIYVDGQPVDPLEYLE